jgi:hypothetical protein
MFPQNKGEIPRGALFPCSQATSKTRVWALYGEQFQQFGRGRIRMTIPTTGNAGLGFSSERDHVEEFPCLQLQISVVARPASQGPSTRPTTSAN